MVPDSPGQFDIRRTVTAMAGDLQELPAETKVVGGFEGRAIRTMSFGHFCTGYLIRAGPWEEPSTRQQTGPDIRCRTRFAKCAVVPKAQMLCPTSILQGNLNHKVYY